MNKYIEGKNLSDEELWNWCLNEYKSSNFIIKYLINNFYKCIKNISELFEPDFKILEVGCGAAESSDRIRNIIGDLHFEISDYDERYVNLIIKKKPHFKNYVEVESIYNLKRKDNEFDCIFVLEVLEHLDNYKLALEEVFRVSRKYVVISVPNEPMWRVLNMLRLRYINNFGNTPGHINHFNSKILNCELTKFGDVLRIYKPIPWLIALVKVKK